MLFEQTNYKPYLAKKLKEKGYGARSRLAEALRCQPSFVAQVLNGSVHLSAEQAEEVNLFLLHSDLEASYFLTLVQYNRAGTEGLKRRTKKELEQLRLRSKQLKHRLKDVSKVTGEDLLQYFSSWTYVAIHALCFMGQYHDSQSIAERLKISPRVVDEVLKYLLEKKLVKKHGGKLVVESPSFHLDGDSPLVIQHHTSWRMKAMRSFEAFNRDNLHYSSVVTLSRDDRDQIRTILVAVMDEIRDIIRDSKGDEVLMSFCTDFFEV